MINLDAFGPEKILEVYNPKIDILSKVRREVRKAFKEIRDKIDIC